jgi:hypothetical protein
MSWTRESLLMNVTCVPRVTVMLCGDTALLLMVIVFDAGPGLGAVLDDDVLPHEMARATTAAEATPAASMLR